MSATLALAEALIARRSVTPEDDGCQALLAERLGPLGFDLEAMPFGAVSNLWAVKRGAAATPALVVFAGHTDVVPPGPLDAWTSDPFVPTHRDGKLYGRGAADMKGSIAAMVVAAEEFVRAVPGHAASLGFLITSDEEGPSTDGTAKVCAALAARGVRIDACVVGEPTSVQTIGDTIKNGRRGTLSGRLRVVGLQGHVAYPQLARNPIHLAAPVVAELASTEWDRGNAHFPPTTFQVSNFHAGTGAGNVVPGEATIDFNFRFASVSTADALRSRTESILRHHLGSAFAVRWTLGGEPFLTEPGALSDALVASIREHAGVEAELATTGGTSDGRFIKRIAREVIELGPINATIHQVDECVDVAGLDVLKNVYRGVLERLAA